MKILWISSWFGDYRIPVYDGLNRLSDNQFYIICSKGDNTQTVVSKLQQKLSDHAIMLEGQKMLLLGSNRSDFANTYLELRWQKGLYSNIKSCNPDVVIVEGFGRWAPIGVLYAKLHRKKLLLFYERTFWTERNASLFRKLYRRAIGTFVDAFLLNGHQSKKYLIEGLKIANKPTTIGCMCADSVNLQQSVKNVTPNELNQLKDSLHLSDGLIYMFVGRIVEPKGVNQLLSAWAKHIETYPKDSIILLGDGPLLQELKDKYSKHDSIHFLGNIDYSNIHLYYALSDVVVMPTLEDNWSLVVPEAMACKKPVASSIYNGGCTELIKDGVNGYQFDPLNQEDFLSVLSKFHNADLKSMGEEGYLIEKNYSPEKSVQRIYNTCKEIYENRL